MALTRKRAYTLDADVVTELEQEFGPGERSRFVSEAARRALISRRGRQFLRDREQQFGAVPEELQRVADSTPIPS